MELRRLLAHDQRTALALLEQLEGTTGAEQKRRWQLFGQLANELEAQVGAEEQVLHTALRGDPSTAPFVARGAGTHAALREVLAALRGMRTADGAWMARLADLHETLELHFAEQDELLARARTVLGTMRARDVAERFAALKHSFAAS